MMKKKFYYNRQAKVNINVEEPLFNLSCAGSGIYDVGLNVTIEVQSVPYTDQFNTSWIFYKWDCYGQQPTTNPATITASTSNTYKAILRKNDLGRGTIIRIYDYSQNGISGVCSYKDNNNSILNILHVSTPTLVLYGYVSTYNYYNTLSFTPDVTCTFTLQDSAGVDIPYTFIDGVILFDFTYSGDKYPILSLYDN